MENEAISRQIVLSLKEKVASQEELILLLKHENDELKSQIKHSDENQCPNIGKVRQLEMELELNIVDLKIKMAELVNKLNDAEFRNNRLEGILFSSTGNYAKLAQTLDKAASDGLKKKRQSALLLRTLSEKLKVNVPQTAPQNQISSERYKADPLFESVFMKLEEFRKNFEEASDADPDAVGRNFELVCSAVLALLGSLNHAVNTSRFLQQRVCFMRSCSNGSLLNLIASQESDGCLQLLARLFNLGLARGDVGGEGNGAIDLSDSPDILHPLVQRSVLSAKVESVFSEDCLRVVFTDKLASGKLFGRIILRRNVPDIYEKLQEKMQHISRLFNQIWRYKSASDTQMPPCIAFFNVLVVANRMVVHEFIPGLTPLIDLKKQTLSDVAQETVMFTTAGLVVLCYVFGIEMEPVDISVDNFGRVYLKKYKTLFDQNVQNINFDDAVGLNINKKTVAIKIPMKLQQIFGKSGALELASMCLMAFLNIRMYSTSTKRYAAMVFANLVKPRAIENYINQALLINATFSDATEMMKKALCANPLVHMADLEKHLYHFRHLLYPLKP